MKYILTLSLLFLSTLFYAQKGKTMEPAVFIDLTLIAINSVGYINQDEIESVNVIKKDTIINGFKYHDQLYITSKNPKKYDFLSLGQIKSEFTKIRSNDVLFMVNGTLIKENIDTFKLDRNYILTVEVTNSEAFYNLRKSDKKIDIINILGKTNENLEAKNKTQVRNQQVIGIK